MEVREVAAAATAELRHAVLGSGPDVSLPPDETPALHLGAYDDGVLVGAGQVFKEPSGHPSETWWRIRGVATHPDHRRHGVGTAVVEALLQHGRTHGGGGAWATARVEAVPFFTRLGFLSDGEERENPEDGTYVPMYRGL